MKPPRPVFLLRLKPEPGVDALRALRLALKDLLRRHGLRCLTVTSEEPAPASPAGAWNQED